MDITKIEALYQKLFEKCITLKNIKSKSIKAACFKPDEDSDDDNFHYAIFFDTEKFNSPTEEYVAILHESYHIEYDAFYYLKDSLHTRKRREHKANKAMVQDIIPIEQLKKALERGLERWELAEEFNITEETILLAFKIYKQMGLLPKL